MYIQKKPLPLYYDQIDSILLIIMFTDQVGGLYRTYTINWRAKSAEQNGRLNTQLSNMKIPDEVSGIH